MTEHNNPLFDEGSSPRLHSAVNAFLTSLSDKLDNSLAANAALAEQVSLLSAKLLDLEDRVPDSAGGGANTDAKGPTEASQGSLRDDGTAPVMNANAPTVIRQAPAPARRRFEGTPGSHPEVFRGWRAAVEMALEMYPDPAFGVQYIFQCLESTALNWWTLTGSVQLKEAGIPLTAKSMLDALQARFLVRDSQWLLRRDLEAFKLGRKESILDYYHRLLEFRSRCPSLTTDELLRRFESGLPSSFRDRLDDLAQDNRVRDPSFEWTLDSMKEYLLDWESRGTLPKWPGQANVLSSPTNSKPYSSGRGSGKKKRRAWLSHDEYRRRVENGLCFTCGHKREGTHCPRCAKKNGSTEEPNSMNNGPQSPNAQEASTPAQH